MKTVTAFLTACLCVVVLSAHAQTAAPQGGASAPAVVPPGFQLSPKTIDFGDVNTGGSKVDSVFITNTGTSQLSVSNVTSSSPRWSVTPKNANIAVGATRGFAVTYSPLAPGPDSSRLRFVNNATSTRDTMMVYGNGVGSDLSPHFSVSPLALDFGDVNTGTNKVDSVIVTNDGSSTLTISMVTSTLNLFTVTPANATVAAGASRTFRITFAPTMPGQVGAFIRFTHNAKSGRDSVAVAGNGVGLPTVPVFTVAPKTLAFGDVQTGTTKTDSVVVTNGGTQNLIIQNIQFGTTIYTVVPATATIAGGASRTFVVTYAPVAPGVMDAFMVFNHNASTRRDTVKITASAFGDVVAPIFSAAPTSIDFGNVQNGTNKRDSVIVTNTGKAVLTITRVNSTDPTFTVQPPNASIAAGESRSFVITFAPMADGARTGRIIFQHNAISVRDTVLVTGTGFGGTPTPKFSVSPTSLAFGTVQTGTINVDSVTVTNTGTATLLILMARSTNNVFTVTPANGNIPAGESRVFRVTFSPVTAGDFKGAISWTHNAVPNVDSITVTGSATGPDVKPAFSVAPAVLNMGVVDSGATKTDSVLVTNTGTASLNVTNTMSTNPRFTITPRIATIPAGESRWFVVTFRAGGVGKYTAWGIFQHNAPGTPDSVEINAVVVSSVPYPVFSVQPKTLNFGTVDVPGAKTDTVVVTNIGRTPLVISNVTPGDPQFTVLPTTASIEEGASATFHITFTPASSAAAASTVLFSHNAPNLTDTVQVRGNTLQLSQITDARTAANGTEVLVQGIVTRCMGQYTRIQDATGGITIRQTLGAFATAVASGEIRMGDIIRVHGRTSEQQSLKMISQTDILDFTRLQRDQTLPVPIEVTLAELAKNGETYESRLVTVRNLTITKGVDTAFIANRSYNIIDMSDTSHTVLLRIAGAQDTQCSGMHIPTYATFNGVVSQGTAGGPGPGAARYQLFPVLTTDLTELATAVESAAPVSTTALLGAYPNPFRPSTTITWQLASAAHVTLHVYSVLGQEVARLADGAQDAGMHLVQWNGRDASGAQLPAGTYYCRLTATAAGTATVVDSKVLVLTK